MLPSIFLVGWSVWRIFHIPLFVTVMRSVSLVFRDVLVSWISIPSLLLYRTGFQGEENYCQISLYRGKGENV